jgi:hypothetical protein
LEKQETMKNFKLFKSPVPTKDELYIRDIVDSFLLRDEVQKLVNPIFNEYFLIDRVNDVNVCISDANVEISNHKFLYRRQIPLKLSDTLTKKIATKIGEEVQVVKKELFRNEIDLLRNIFKY